MWQVSRQTASRSGFLDAVQDTRDLLKPPAQIRPLPRRRLNRHPHLRARCFRVDDVQALNQPRDPDIFPRPAVRAGMADQKIHAQRLRPLDLRPKGRAGLGQHVAARFGGQIDQIRIVRDGLGDAALGDDLLELRR